LFFYSPCSTQGFKPSKEKQEAIEKANALVVHAAVHGGEEVPVHDDYDELDLSKLPIQAQEQLSKIDSLLETGLLSKEEVDQLRPVILAQAKELMATLSNTEHYDTFPMQGTVAGGGSFRSAGAFRPQMMRQTSNFDELGYTGEVSPNLMVVCDVCSILNMHGGQNCMVCNARLPSPDAPKQQEKVNQRRQSVQINATSFIPPPSGFGPDSGVWLCSVPFRGNGVFKAYVMDAVSVMDQQTWEQTAVYIVGCEFTNGLTVHEQWTARHNWKWIDKWAAKLKTDTKFAVPELGKVEPKEANSTRGETMKKLKNVLNVFLTELMKGVTASNSQQFLDNDLVDKFFKIRDNVLEELDQEQFQEAYKTVLSADLGASDANTPLTLEEMQIADDAGTLLITFIRGDGTTKAVDINNDRVQDLRSVCITAIPRLRASQDLENPQVIKELVPQALDVLEHLENAIRVYNDSEAVMQASITGQVQ